MAEEAVNEQETGAEEGAESSGGGSKLLIIIILAVVLVAGAGVAAFLFLGSSSDEAAADEVAAEVAPAAAPAASATEGAATAMVNQPFFYEVPEILVNLSSSGASNRYLKLKVNLEVKSEVDLLELEKVMPRVIDDFQVYLRQLRPEDLTGSAGIYRLKEALLLRANQSAQPLQINNVLFKEILVQ